MGSGLRRALRAFQAGQGLREDATITPGGPTERGLAESLLTGFLQDPAIRAQLAELQQQIPPLPRRKPDPKSTASDQRRTRTSSAPGSRAETERKSPASQAPLPPFPESSQSETERIPPVPPRKPFAGPPVPRRKPLPPEPDPNLGGVEPEFDPVGGLPDVAKILTPALLAQIGLTNAANATAFLSGSGPVVTGASLAPLLPASLVAFMFGAFGNNGDLGFGQNPIGP